MNKRRMLITAIIVMGLSCTVCFAWIANYFNLQVGFNVQSQVPKGSMTFTLESGSTTSLTLKDMTIVCAAANDDLSDVLDVNGNPTAISYQVVEYEPGDCTKLTLESVKISEDSLKDALRIAIAPIYGNKTNSTHTYTADSTNATIFSKVPNTHKLTIYAWYDGASATPEKIAASNGSSVTLNFRAE